MSRITVGLVDYGVGNHASVSHALHDAGFRVRVAGDAPTLDVCDVLLLPGVGAFPAAMARLRETGLDRYLQQAAEAGRPLLGICLGMQLLARESLEMGPCDGLGILPGRVVPLDRVPWHIGWNTLESVGDDPAFLASHGESFYFNHSFMLVDAPNCITAIARVPQPVAAAVRRDRVAGLQFHPEKSQRAGMRLLHTLIAEIARA
ncbi:MAG: imidazole glycerol phosphate synthase subunit HisH [Hydrogenophaga sp.]|uniref:imidazole glycerol phosphate synthase subunit HisH n=1 Tax=Hydrogenophaga sp. TaxID=1904254 RepID=UPI002604736C|nr:imidazole glycerol phosphate synthase subunit HisH [Hydrogenophaga sp.]MCV0437842.1 imidazole glycerol phosphate synthase subunit HisH [Hydrogenophaga sp.]